MNEKVIVSMTSFPAAIPYAVKAVRSLLQGSVLPDKVILYLTFSQFGEEGLPSELTELVRTEDIFEIRDYPKDIRSYRKLIPALKEFPDDIIVTVDDDVHYHRDMLRDLLKWHREYPDAVIAHRAKRISVGKPYKKWKKLRWYHFLLRRIYADPFTIQTGVGGVLYPPHSLSSEMTDGDEYRKLAPTADDFWFWASAVANGRMVIPVPFGHNKPHGLGKPKSLSLKTVNFKTGEDRNSAAFRAILEHYPKIRKMMNQ